MLKITLQTPSGPVIRSMYVIDAHSHLGKDVDGAEMMNPQTPGSGTYDFWTKVESALLSDWEKRGQSNVVTIKYNNQMIKAQIDFEQQPMISKLYEALEKRNKSGSYTGALERIKYQRLIDQSVVFPFQDQFRDKQPEARYRASNMNIARQVGKFPNSFRLIGYMRCDPNQGQQAVDEVAYWGQTNTIRGLKLHPRSEGWVDHINSTSAIQILMKAAELGFPVIFDTRGKQSILDIGTLIQSARQAIAAQKPALLSQLKVIIAHFSQGNVDDHEVYNVITQPNTWGDLSMIHGQGIVNFFTSFRTYCEQNNVKARSGRIWSEHLLYASDYPYFGERHTKDILDAVLNQEFYNSGGTLNDVANILGQNQLRLLPEYQIPVQSKNYVKGISCTLQSTELLPKGFPKLPPNPVIADELMFQSLATMIDDGKIEIQKILYTFHEDWTERPHEFCLITSPKAELNKEIPLVYQKLGGDQLGLFFTLPAGFEWNKFGYQYFNSEDRKLFQQIFINHYPGTVPDDAAIMLSNAYI